MARAATVRGAAMRDFDFNELLGILRGFVKRKVAATKVSDLNDVQLTSLSDGDSVFYDAESEKWINAPAGSVTDNIYSEIQNLFS